MLLAEKLVEAIQLAAVFVVVLFWIGNLGKWPRNDWRS
jgi:hypothetical protein